MIEHPDGARLLFEAAQPVGIARHCGGQQFDGDFAPDTRVSRGIDFAHPAGAMKEINS